ncbi:MAG: methyltransferase [Flavobacteriaceae bacterium]
MSFFKFKQFTIQQDKCAMKVGTDGVLLGAWVKIKEDVINILDIGSGTGLIALQMAQRSNAELIDAVEIEPQAYEQTVENFEASDWSDRLFCYHSSFQDFADEIEEKYDLIVSNPPFFECDNQIKSKERALARQNTHLSYDDLLRCSAQLLSEKGSCAFIIPYLEEKIFLDLASKNKLYPQRITRVKGNKATATKRSLLQFSFTETRPKIEELVIELSRHNYTEDYKYLVKDFYLKM